MVPSGGLNELISIPARFCGLSVVQGFCHKNVIGFSLFIMCEKLFFRCKKGDNNNNARNDLAKSPLFLRLKRTK